MATINYNSGNINVSFFPSNVNPIWFCDNNTGGVNIATNGAAIAANTLQLGNLNTTTQVNGTLKTNTITSNNSTTLSIGNASSNVKLGTGLNIDFMDCFLRIYSITNAGGYNVTNYTTGSEYSISLWGGSNDWSTMAIPFTMTIRANATYRLTISCKTNYANGMQLSLQIPADTTIHTFPTRVTTSYQTLVHTFTAGSTDVSNPRFITTFDSVVVSGKTFYWNDFKLEVINTLAIDRLFTRTLSLLNQTSSMVQENILGFNSGGGIGIGTEHAIRLRSQGINRDNGAGPYYDYGAQAKLFFEWHTSNQFSGNPAHMGYATAMTIDGASGNVGIATSTPGCPLEIGVTKIITTAAGYYWRSDSATGQAWPLNGGVGTSVKALGSFVTSDAFVAVSDRRIKTNIVDVLDDTALQLFRRLQPKTYEYVDKVRKGPASVYGFIAQEVREVLPLASRIMTDTAPNLYAMCEVSGDILTLDTTLLEYDASGQLFPKLKLINEDDTDLFVKILAVNADSVQIDKTLSEDKVFVYGQEVNNFHTLNKDAIWTVAAAALQEVDRQVQRLDEQLQAEKEKTKTLEQNYEQLLQRILALESKGSAP